MRKINLRFVGTGYNNYYQAEVKIFDKCNKLVYRGYTYNGRVTVCLKDNCFYKIKATLNNQIINTKIFVNNCICNYEFIFYNCCLNNNIDNEVTFLLTDYYYSNLPIERGNLILNG